MVIILMGVSGSGKSTIGWQLANQLQWRFEDADDWHSSQNLTKMRRGIPLTDHDRDPWLRQLQRAIDEWRMSGENVILACSALKQYYRERLRCYEPDVQLVYLRGSVQAIQQRISQRHGHFMPRQLLTSQFDALEEPRTALTVDIQKPPSEIVQDIIQELNLTNN